MNLKQVCALVLAFASAPSYSQSSPEQSTPTSTPVLIEGVECRGNAKTSCDSIRRKLKLPVDSRIDDEAVQSAQLRLSALPIFRSVYVHLEKGSAKGKAKMVIEVEEASPINAELTAGLTYVSIQFPYAALSAPTTHLWAEQLAGRISNQNLFGSQKIIEGGLSASHVKIGDFDREGLVAQTTYIDPSLFGSDRIFLSAGGSFSYQDGLSTSGSPTNPAFTVRTESRAKTTYLNVAVGYRVWDYSYFFTGFSFQALRQDGDTFFGSPVTQILHFENNRHSNIWRFGYVRDSEDDAYFPTRGSRLTIAGSYSADDDFGPQPLWFAAYKKTWSSSAASVWTLNIGGEPSAPADRLRPLISGTPAGLGLTYARAILPTEHFGGTDRGRWYVQLATGPIEISREGRIGGHPTIAAMKIGVRLETRILGVVDLYAMGSRQWPR